MDCNLSSSFIFTVHLYTFFLSVSSGRMAMGYSYYFIKIQWVGMMVVWERRPWWEVGEFGPKAEYFAYRCTLQSLYCAFRIWTFRICRIVSLPSTLRSRSQTQVDVVGELCKFPLQGLSSGILWAQETCSVATIFCGTNMSIRTKKLYCWVLLHVEVF